MRENKRKSTHKMSTPVSCPRNKAIMLPCIALAVCACSMPLQAPSFTPHERAFVTRLFGLFEENGAGGRYFSNSGQLKYQSVDKIKEKDVQTLVKERPDLSACVAIKLFDRASAGWEEYEQVFWPGETAEQNEYALKLHGRVCLDLTLARILARAVKAAAPEKYEQVEEYSQKVEGLMLSSHQVIK